MKIIPDELRDGHAVGAAHRGDRADLVIAAYRNLGFPLWVNRHPRERLRDRSAGIAQWLEPATAVAPGRGRRLGARLASQYRSRSGLAAISCGVCTRAQFGAAGGPVTAWFNRQPIVARFRRGPLLCLWLAGTMRLRSCGPSEKSWGAHRVAGTGRQRLPRWAVRLIGTFSLRQGDGLGDVTLMMIGVSWMAGLSHPVFISPLPAFSRYHPLIAAIVSFHLGRFVPGRGDVVVWWALIWLWALAVAQALSFAGAGVCLILLGVMLTIGGPSNTLFKAYADEWRAIFVAAIGRRS